MIKLITLITKLIVIALMTLLFGSCGHLINHKSIEGSGHVTTEKRIVEGDFKSVEVSNAIDLVIEQSDKTEIIVENDVFSLPKGQAFILTNGGELYKIRIPLPKNDGTCPATFEALLSEVNLCAG